MTARYYCDVVPLITGEDVRLSRDESKHLLKVMRGRPGDEIVVFGSGKQFSANLIGADETGLAVVKIADRVVAPNPAKVRMTFLVPWIKGGKTELLVQKLTELGAWRILVFHARREVARGDDAKCDRLRRVALEACKQCERTDVPEILSTSALADGLALADDVSPDHRFLLHERRGDNLFSKVAGPVVTKKCNILVASGPEGGWDPKEVESVSGKVVVVSLGQRILRAETAPIAAASAVLALSGDM